MRKLYRAAMELALRAAPLAREGSQPRIEAFGILAEERTANQPKDQAADAGREHEAIGERDALPTPPRNVDDEGPDDRAHHPAPLHPEGKRGDDVAERRAGAPLTGRKHVDRELEPMDNARAELRLGERDVAGDGRSRRQPPGAANFDGGRSMRKRGN